MYRDSFNYEQYLLVKNWNADAADACNADFRGLICNPFLSAFENLRFQRSIFQICLTNAIDI
jgi:hypothetical protein